MSTGTSTVRASGVACKLKHGGEEYSVTSFSFSNGLNSIPRASVKLPIGKAVDEYIGLGHSDSDINQEVFNRFDPIEVVVTITGPSGSRGGVGTVLAPGSYTVFKGSIDTKTVVRSPRSIDLVLECQHSAALLTSASSVFSPFMPTDLIDMNVVYNGTLIQNSKLIVEMRRAFWASIVSGVNKVFSVAQATGQNARKALQWVRDNDLELLMEESEEVLARIKDMDGSRLTLAVNPDTILNSAADMFKHAILTSLRSKPALWEVLLGLGDSFGFVMVPDVSDVYVLPYYPFLDLNDCKELGDGELIYVKRAPADTDYLTVVGTLLTSIKSGFLVPEAEIETPTFNGVAYTLPDAQNMRRQGAVLQLLRGPPWLVPKVVFDRVELDTEEDEKEEGPQVPALDMEESQSALRQFARMQTLRRFFGKTSVEIVTPLRFDILPGQCLKFRFLEDTGDFTTIVGYVESVATTIATSSGDIDTRVMVSCPKTEEEHNKYVVDGPGNRHFFFSLAGMRDWKDKVWCEVSA